ncbi:hypothetical protein D3C76_1118350 [compost metagenome]
MDRIGSAETYHPAPQSREDPNQHPHSSVLYRRANQRGESRGAALAKLQVNTPFETNFQGQPKNAPPKL